MYQQTEEKSDARQKAKDKGKDGQHLIPFGRPVRPASAKLLRWGDVMQDGPRMPQSAGGERQPKGIRYQDEVADYPRRQSVDQAPFPYEGAHAPWATPIHDDLVRDEERNGD
jgi:hypothetical protein